MKKNMITIDGPSASGKSSLSRSLARKLGWLWVSTGAFYRALAIAAEESDTNLEDPKALVELFKKHSIEVKPHALQTEVYIDNKERSFEEIYSEANGGRASTLSKHQAVRDAVLNMQRDCYQEPGLIAEGRDCGTVIFPEAQLKIFLEASKQSRIMRRSEQESKDFKEHKTSDQKALAKDIEQRDLRDSTRKAAPMVKAKDAWSLDTSNLSLEEVVELVLKKVESVF
jgi:cytidylate kinase